jgi:anti-sigma regulatory factor (Ser/Thr protein kinase)
MAQAQGKSQTTRMNVTFSVTTVEYLEELATKGTHGSDVVSAIRTMVEEGVRNAIRDGFIDAR